MIGNVDDAQITDEWLTSERQRVQQENELESLFSIQNVEIVKSKTTKSSRLVGRNSRGVQTRGRGRGRGRGAGRILIE